jgi:predicted amidophosphoribosyltransferase
MPTFKHPCPYCDKFIDRAVAACPYCGQTDPFAPKRCQNCRKVVEDPAWVTCPTCGQSLIAPPPVAAPAAAGAGPAGATAGDPAAAVEPPPPPRPPLYKETASGSQPVAQAALPGGACSGCGAPLPAGARFCTVCGTVAG